MAIFFSVDAALTTAASALVVEPSPAEAVSIVSMLAQLGFRVAVTDNFLDAKTRLLTKPDLLVTELRLGEYNGLHLVLRGKSARSEMAALVMSRIADPVLNAEAERLGSTFVQKSVTPDEFRAAVCRTLFRTSPEPVRPPFERRRIERRLQPSGHEPERRVQERRRDVAELINRTAAS